VTHLNLEAELMTAWTDPADPTEPFHLTPATGRRFDAAPTASNRDGSRRRPMRPRRLAAWLVLAAGALLAASVVRAEPPPVEEDCPDGRIPVPVVTVHGIGDPTAFVEMEASLSETMRKAGSADRLVQVFTEDASHSYLSDPVYPTVLAELVKWIDTGDKPTSGQVAQSCQGFEARFGKGCRFLPDYQPGRLADRVPAR